MILGTFLQQFSADQKIIIKNESGQSFESIAGYFYSCLCSIKGAAAKGDFLIITLSEIDYIINASSFV